MTDYCPVCRNKEYEIIGDPKTNYISAGFINKSYKIVQCCRCKVYYVFPGIDFSDEQWSMLYNEEYFSNQSKWLIKRRAEELKERFDKAEHFLNAKKIWFLDIGTGEGKALLEGVRRGWEVTGIDIVDNRISEAKTDDIRFIKAKFPEYNFQDNYFDFIYLDSVLEHVLQPAEYLGKIKKILKPGGIIYIGIPNEDSLFNDIRKIIFYLIRRGRFSVKIKPFDAPYHVIGFNSYSFNYLVKDLGIKFKLFRNIGRKFDFLSSPVFSKGFWISLVFLLPIEMIGSLIKRDVYFEAYLQKMDPFKSTDRSP